MILLDKILSAFALPLGLALAGLVLAFLTMAMGAKRLGFAGAFVVMVGLWAASTPIVAGAAISVLERQYPPDVVEEDGTADVIIVLGGALSLPTAFNPYADLGEGADWVFHALRLFKAGKARKILLSGGDAFDGEAVLTEAHAMAELLVSFGVEPEAIITEPRSRNTYENARLSKVIWLREGFKTGLLVTSALHMPRALATFRKAGMAVNPASTDAVSGGGPPPFPLQFLPSSGSLDATTRALKEWLGFYVYHLRGYA